MQFVSQFVAAMLLFTTSLMVTVKDFISPISNSLSSTVTVEDHQTGNSEKEDPSPISQHSTVATNTTSDGVVTNPTSTAVNDSCPVPDTTSKQDEQIVKVIYDKQTNLCYALEDSLDISVIDPLYDPQADPLLTTYLSLSALDKTGGYNTVVAECDLWTSDIGGSSTNNSVSVDCEIWRADLLTHTNGHTWSKGAISLKEFTNLLQSIFEARGQ